ncbi:MAG: response regulator [Epsilonproteobacteria bacterium]|nr:response regulator [Campylobacterota bacterium]
MKTKRILTVDDYPLAAYTVKKTVEAFSKYPCNISEFEDPVALLVTFQEEFENVDLIITDFEMPNLHGSALIKKLREIKPDIKIIVISAWLDSVSKENDELIEQKIRKLNPNYILSKPFPDAWVEKVDMLLSESD